jgi:hypothetical protein
MRRSTFTRTAPAVAALLLASACSRTTSPPSVPATVDPSTFALEQASTDLYAGHPIRVQFGVFQSSQQGGVRLLTSGSIQMQVAPYGGGAGTPIDGSAHYLGAPGTEADTGTPHLSDPGTARGVYELDGTFDRAGVWQAQATFTVDGTPLTLSAVFPVLAKPKIPAPGQPAFMTRNLTMASHVDPAWIDSRAQGGAAVPDPQLHRDTIAGAIAAHRAALVLFATPVYCQSQFCGPTVDALARIAKTGPKVADYVHIEIYKDFATQTVNDAARQWVIRAQTASDPWLFLIGRDGRIVDRWGPLFDPAQVLRELRAAAG